MNKSKFLSIFLALNVFFIFLKIYQHNSLIKLNYKKQRFEKIKATLKKDKNELIVQLSNIKDQQNVMQNITQKFGMQNLQLSQIITNTIDKYNQN